MSRFDIKKFLTENKLTLNSQLLNEGDRNESEKTLSKELHSFIKTIPDYAAELRTELEVRIEKILEDEVRNFNPHEERPEDIHDRFKTDEYWGYIDEITSNALTSLRTDESETLWHNEFGDNYDEKQIEFAEWIYHSMVDGLKFLQKIEEELSNYFSHFEK